MPVAPVGTPVTATSARSKGGGTPVTINAPITVPAGTDLLLTAIQFSVGGSGAWASPPTFNSIPMSTYVTLAANRLELFYLINPPAGTFNLYANATSVVDGGSLIMQSSMFDGVDTAAPFSGWTNRGNLPGTTPYTTPAMPSVANSMLMLFHSWNAAGSGITRPSWSVTAPGYLNAQVGTSYSDGTKSCHTFNVTARQAGTGANLSFTVYSTYNLYGPYYSFNILPKLPKGKTQTIFFF